MLTADTRKNRSCHQSIVEHRLRLVWKFLLKCYLIFWHLRILCARVVNISVPINKYTILRIYDPAILTAGSLTSSLAPFWRMAESDHRASRHIFLYACSTNSIRTPAGAKLKFKNIFFADPQGWNLAWTHPRQRMSRLILKEYNQIYELSIFATIWSNSTESNKGKYI